MNSNSSSNEGVQNIADFQDRAIPLSDIAAGSERAGGTRSANEGIYPLASFEDQAQQPGPLGVL
jgi:hypothetical protein